MKKWIVIAVWCCCGLLRAEPNTPVCNPNLSCLPKDKLMITVPKGAKADTAYQVTFTSLRNTIASRPLVPLASVAQNSSACDTPFKPTTEVPLPGGFCASIPEDLVDGVYTISIAEKDTPTATLSGFSPAEIKIQRPAITAVWPEGSFLEAATSNKQVNKIVVLGSGFRRGDTSVVKPIPQGSQVFDDPPIRLRLVFPYAATPPNCGELDKSVPRTNCWNIHTESDTQATLTFYGVSPGPRVFILQLDGVKSNESNLALIHAGSDYPLTVAVVVVLLIVVVVYAILRSGRKATSQKMNGKEYWLSALFLDVPTNTYSLSKCQFYAWTAAAVFGYIFLAVSKSVVQGSGVFPDIPPGLPGIILASVGTVVVSQGIASAKGDKGAGNPGPNLSDFISTGGVIAADRLQFAIWTIIGIGTFLSLVIQTDPRKINDLPAIPSGFMQLMGISSAGYLAGKLVRKPGPTIANVVVKYTNPVPPPAQPATPPQGQSSTAQPAPPKSTLRYEITGSCLSRSASFYAGDQQIFPDLLVGDNGLKGAQILKPDPSNNDPDLASVLTFTVPNPPITYLGAHPFTIINPDAQKAVKDYEVFNVKDVVISKGAGTITVTGECLGTNLKPTCANCGDATPAASGNTDKTFVWKMDMTKLNVGDTVTVTFADGSAGGKLDVQTVVKD